MRKMVKQVTILSLFFVGLCSCEKNSEVIKQAESSGMKESIILTEMFNSIDIRLAENPNNPYDDFGKAHFAGVAYTLPRLYATNDFSVGNLNKMIAKFVSSESGLRNATSTQLSEVQLEEIYKSVRDNLNLQSDKNYSQEMLNQVERFSSVLKQLKSSDDEDCNFENVKSQLISYESSVQKNFNLSNLEKKELLCAASTFRYSALQWEKPIDMLISTRDIKETNVKKIKLKWYHWLIVAGADALGALKSVSVTDAIAASDFAYNRIKENLERKYEAKKDLEVNKQEVDNTDISSPNELKP